MANRERNWGIDILRIICMVAMIVQHILGHGWITQQIHPESWKYSFVISLQSFSLFGISCFAMISGYVGVSTRYRYTTLALQWIKVFLYSVLFTLIVMLAKPGTVTKEQLLMGFFPTMRKQWWYFTAYVGCFLTAPLINTAIKQLNKKQAGLCIATMMFVFSGLNFFNGDPFNVGAGKNVLWLIVLYALGAYMGHFGMFQSVSTRWVALMAAGSAVLAVCAGGVTARICELFTGERAGYWLFHRNDSPTTVLMAMMMLLLFSRLRISRGTKLLTLIAPLNFSVYLIHDHPLVRRYTISVYARHLANLSNLWIVPGIVLSAIGIYLICILIDYFRERAFRKLRLKRRLSALEDKIVGTIWDE